MTCEKLFTVASNQRNANKILQHYCYQIFKDLKMRPSQDQCSKQEHITWIQTCPTYLQGSRYSNSCPNKFTLQVSFRIKLWRMKVKCNGPSWSGSYPQCSAELENKTVFIEWRTQKSVWNKVPTKYCYLVFFSLQCPIALSPLMLIEALLCEKFHFNF